MAGTRILKTGVPDLYDANIKRAYLQGYGEPEHSFEDFYLTNTSTLQDERATYLSGLGLWQLKPFGDNVAYDTIYQGLAKVVALDKSRVINGENLNAIGRMATLCKQASAVQQQRLSPVTA